MGRDLKFSSKTNAPHTKETTTMREVHTPCPTARPQLEMETTAATPAGTQKVALTKPHGVKSKGCQRRTSQDVIKRLFKTNRRRNQPSKLSSEEYCSYINNVAGFKWFSGDSEMKIRRERGGFIYQNDLYVW